MNVFQVYSLQRFRFTTCPDTPTVSPKREGTEHGGQRHSEAILIKSSPGKNMTKKRGALEESHGSEPVRYVTRLRNQRRRSPRCRPRNIDIITRRVWMDDHHPRKARLLTLGSTLALGMGYWFLPPLASSPTPWSLTLRIVVHARGLGNENPRARGQWSGASELILDEVEVERRAIVYGL